MLCKTYKRKLELNLLYLGILIHASRKKSPPEILQLLTNDARRNPYARACPNQLVVITWSSVAMPGKPS